MTDIAALGFQVDSDGIVRAAKALDDLAASADRAGASSAQISGGNAKIVSSINGVSTQLDKVIALLASVDRALANAGSGAATAAAELADVGRAGATAAAGLNTMNIAGEATARVYAQLGTSTTKLSITYSQTATAAQATSAALASQASAAQNAANEIQQLDAHVVAYQAHLANMGRFTQPFDAHVDAFRRLKKPIDDAADGMHKTSGAGRMLGQQLSQVAQQVAAGGNALQAFAIQLPDIAMGINTAGQSAGRFATFIGGPWGIALASAVSVIGALAAGHMAASDASDEHSKAAEALSNSIDRLAEATRQETSTLVQNTQARIENAISMRKQTEETLKLAQAELARQKSFLRGAEDEQGNAFSGEQFLQAEGRRNSAAAAIDAQLKQIDELQAKIAKSNASVRDLQSIIVNDVGARYFDAAGRATRNFDNRLGDLTARFRDGKISLNQYASEAAKLRGVLHSEQEAIEATNRSHRTRKAAMSNAEKAANQAAREYEREIEASKQYAESLEDQAAKFGKSATEIQRLEVASRAATAPTAELAQRIRDAGAALETTQLNQAAIDFNRMVTAIYDEIEASRLVGKEREIRALALEKDAKMAEWARQGLTDLDQRWQEYAAARLYGIEQKSVLERDAEAAARLLEQMGALTNVMSRGAIGGLLGALASGNATASLLGMGGIGSLLGLMTGPGRDAYQKQGEIIAQNISDVFGIKGPFAKTMAGVLQGSALGSLGGSIIGKNNIGSQIGGALGGALMSGGLGKTITGGLTKALGSTIGGALSSAIPVIGGVLGGLIGSLFGSAPPSGSARITNATANPIRTGNNSALNAQAGTLAQSVQSGLIRVADQFGALLGDFNVAIGIYKDTVRVNYSGGATNGVRVGTAADRDNFGSNSDAAVKAAIQNAIADGALQGVNPAIQKLLSAGKDLELSLQKALDFQGVFDELKSIKDPVGFAVGQVEKQFGKLRKIFDEAGATVEDRAQLEELYALKLEEARRQAEQAAAADETVGKRRELEIALMQAQGDVMGALAAQRADELAQLPETLRGLQQQVWAAELANQKRSLEIQLMQAQGDAAGALTAQRAIDLAAMDESLRALQQQVWAAQDAAAANQSLAQAQKEAADAAAAAASRMASLQERLLQARGDEVGLRDFRRTQELSEALSDAEKAMLQQIYAAEDAARAAQALAEAQDAQKRAAEEAARAAEELAQQRSALEIDLLRAQGKEAQAVARERSLALAALDPSLRALQQMVWAEQDLAKVRETAAQKVADARDVLSQAYEREAGALRDTIDRFTDLRATLVDFRKSLFEGAGFSSYEELRARLNQTSSLANAGQEQALRDLPKVAQDFLGAARDRAGSLIEFQLETARVAGILDRAIGSTDAAIDYQQANLDALVRVVQGQIDTKKETVSVRVAIERLEAAVREQGNENLELGVATIRAVKEQTRLFDDLSDGGNELRVSS